MKFLVVTVALAAFVAWLVYDATYYFTVPVVKALAETVKNNG